VLDLEHHCTALPAQLSQGLTLQDEPEVPPGPEEVSAAPSSTIAAAPQPAKADAVGTEPGMLEEDWGVEANGPELVRAFAGIWFILPSGVA